jgi:hypothetical protein
MHSETAKRKVKARRSKRSVPETNGAKHATCGLCGENAEFADWRQLGAWFSAHLGSDHPQELQTLIATSTMFMTWLVARCFASRPAWNEESSVERMRLDLEEILAGKRDPLVDGMTDGGTVQ